MYNDTKPPAVAGVTKWQLETLLPSDHHTDTLQGRSSLMETQLALPNLVRSRGREFDSKNWLMALKFDRRLCSTTTELPVEFQSHLIFLKTNFATSRLDEN